MPASSSAWTRRQHADVDMSTRCQLLVGVSRVALQFSQYKGYTSLLDRERGGFTMSAIPCETRRGGRSFASPATSADVIDTSS
jgi:hypothetical protein